MRIRLRMDPHWFGSLDPDPDWDKSWIRIITNEDPQHSLKRSVFIYRENQSIWNSSLVIWLVDRIALLFQFFHLSFFFSNCRSELDSTLQARDWYESQLQEARCSLDQLARWVSSQGNEDRYGWDLAEWLKRLTVNAVVATVLGSIPAFSNTVESEGRQMTQCWIKYSKKIQKIPLKKKWLIQRAHWINSEFRLWGEFTSAQGRC